MSATDSRTNDDDHHDDRWDSPDDTAIVRGICRDSFATSSSSTTLMIVKIISRGIKETLARRNVANQDAWIIALMAAVTGG